MSRRRPTPKSVRARRSIPVVAPRADAAGSSRSTPGRSSDAKKRSVRGARSRAASSRADSAGSTSQRASSKPSRGVASPGQARPASNTRANRKLRATRPNKAQRADRDKLSKSGTRDKPGQAGKAGKRATQRHVSPVTDIGPVRTDRARRNIKRAARSPLVNAPAPQTQPSRIPFKRYVHAPPPAAPRSYTEEHARRRMIGVLGFVAIVLLLVLGQVGRLQTIGGEALRNEASRQWTRTRTVTAPRGSIFDRNGEELAVSVPAYVVSINPQVVEDADAVVATLDTALDFTDEEQTDLRAALADKSRGFVYVRHQVSIDAGDAIKAMKVPGINVDPEAKRVLPGGETGRSIIGRTDVFGAGTAGLELQYNDRLIGSDGQVTRDVAKGRSIAGSEQVITPPVPGDDIVLTIDRSIQFATEQVLTKRVADLGAKSGTVIVMDVQTGDVYAMASVGRNDNDEVVVSSGNFAAVDAYEPGSVVKVITAAGALDAGVTTTNKVYNVPFRRNFDGHWLADSHQHPDQSLTVSEILVESSNMGTVALMEDLGRQRHWEYMRKFGLGEKTALNFPSESHGILHAWDKLFGIERYTVAFGQGVASTSIQLAAAVNTVANDGVYVAPRIVSATVGPTGELAEAAPATSYKVVSPDAAEAVQKALRQVVCRGTAPEAQEGITKFSVAGKTGTGYKAQPNGTYLDENGNHVYYASFVGFFPAEDPQVTVLVSIDEPPGDSDERYGGTAAAPVFAQLAPTIVGELGIVPPADTKACPNS